ncbi:MAG TPA: hypothetical protein VKN64_06955 [Halanaerobiales bacterium]|nr:hypothetical protein [Halanaerobiales bacterium]
MRFEKDDSLSPDPRYDGENVDIGIFEGDEKLGIASVYFLDEITKLAVSLYIEVDELDNAATLLDQIAEKYLDGDDRTKEKQRIKFHAPNYKEGLYYDRKNKEFQERKLDYEWK